MFLFPWKVHHLPNYHQISFVIFRYHDLSLAFHTNYRQAIDHYIQHVDSEHRVGYMEGGFGGVWTISGHGIYLGASARMGGAIDSLTWNNRELVNSYDHGRELQMACNSNTYAECYNPTEAGGRDDSTSAHTHTHIDWVRASGNVLESQVSNKSISTHIYLIYIKNRLKN